MFAMRYGVFLKHAGTAAAVAEAHHGCVDSKVNVTVPFQVHVVGMCGEFCFRIRYGTCRERLIFGRDADAFSGGVGELYFRHLLKIAGVLRTRIAGVDVLRSGFPFPNLYRLMPVGIVLKRSEAVPSNPVVVFLCYQYGPEPGKFRKLSRRGVGLLKAD